MQRLQQEQLREHQSHNLQLERIMGSRMRLDYPSSSNQITRDRVLGEMPGRGLNSHNTILHKFQPIQRNLYYILEKIAKKLI